MEQRRKYIEGFGSIFRKSFKRKRADGSEYVYENPIWHVAYYHRGEELRESSHSEEEKEAIKLLKRRAQDLGRGVVGTREERLTFEQLTEHLKNDYRINDKRSLDSVELSIRHLSDVFAGDRAVHITTDRIRAYIALRQSEGAANGSVNRELSALKRAFSLAQQAGKIFHRPYTRCLRKITHAKAFLNMRTFSTCAMSCPTTSEIRLAFYI